MTVWSFNKIMFERTKIMEVVMLPIKGMYIASVKEAQVIEGWDNPVGDFAISLQYSPEGFVEDTNVEPWDEWMGKEVVFDRRYFSTPDAPWARRSNEAKEMLMKAFECDEDTLRNHPEDLVGKAFCFTLSFIPGKWAADKEGTKVYIPDKVEVDKLYPHRFSDGVTTK